MIKPLTEAHAAAKAQFDKLAEARGLLDKARAELTDLGKLGDMVTSEDVIKGAGKLVAAGASPLALAKLLSDMPTEGPQLQAWLAQHSTALAQQEAQLQPVLEAARHQLGVTGMRVLTAHSLMPQLAPAPQQPSAAAANPLMPQTETVGNA